MSTPLPIPPITDPWYLADLCQRIVDAVDWPNNSDSCWEWKKTRGHYGHGRIMVRFGYKQSRIVMAHRLVYSLWYGDPGPELVVDHMCMNPPCVNPLHLQAVSYQTNTLRGDGPASENAQKDRCLNGHPLYGDNLYPVAGSSKRRCRACSNEIDRASKDRNDYGFGGKGTRQFRRNGPKKTHCKNGHDWIPENIRIKKNGHAECRACHRERERARQRKVAAAKRIG